MLNYKQLSEAELFSGLSPLELEDILKGLPTKTKDYLKDQIIIYQGSILENIAVVINGTATGVKNGLNGEAIVVAHFKENSTFADILSGSVNFESPVSVIASSTCSILFISYNALLSLSHPKAPVILKNMIKAISVKYLNQNRHLELLTVIGVRKRIVAYLKYYFTKFNTTEFCTPLTRQQLADYLSIERTALSRELSKMAAEGIISYKKSFFCILDINTFK